MAAGVQVGGDASQGELYALLAHVRENHGIKPATHGAPKSQFLQSNFFQKGRGMAEKYSRKMLYTYLYVTFLYDIN